MISLLTYVFFSLLAAQAYSQNAQLTCPVEQMNYTACAGNEVVFNCTTSTLEVRWEVFNTVGNRVAYFYYDSTNTTNDTQSGDVFTFEKIGNNNSILTFEAQYDLNGYTVSCTDVVSNRNSTTNQTTTSNDTTYCSVNIPAIPSPPENPTYSFQGENMVNVSWTYPANPNNCVMMFYVQAVPDNSSLDNVTIAVDSTMTSRSIELNEDVAYTITVIAGTMNENFTSEDFCIQLSSPSMVTELMGMYRENSDDIRVTWEAPMYPSCQRPNVTNYNVTHNATDGNTGGSGSSAAPIVAFNETFTLAANQTWYTFEDFIFGNVYFVEVTPSNTFGFGQSNVIFITATPTTSSTSTSTSTPAASATTSETPTSPSGLSAGAIAGIVVAIVVVIVVIAVITVIIVYLACCRGDDDDYKKSKKKHYKHDEGTKLRQGTDL